MFTISPPLSGSSSPQQSSNLSVVRPRYITGRSAPDICIYLLKIGQPAGHTGVSSILIHSHVFPCPTAHSYLWSKSQVIAPFPRDLSDDCTAESFCASMVCFINSQVNSCILIQDLACPCLHCPHIYTVHHAYRE